MNEKLTGNDRLWWRCCRDAVQSQPYWLQHGDHDKALQVINGGELLASRGAVSRAAEATDLVSRALAGSVDTTKTAGALSKFLVRAAECWNDGPAVITADEPVFAPEKAVTSAVPALRNRLRDVLACLPGIGADAGQAMVAICALLLAAERPDTGRLVRVPVVFARRGARSTASRGVAGILELREFPPGPPGLFPDPRGMRNRRADPAFDDGLQLAWRFARGASHGGRCVLWHLTLDGGAPDYAIDGGSLGAAFAVALRELLRRPRGSRPGFLAAPRAFFTGLRPRCAITGVLTTQRPVVYDRLTPKAVDGPWLDKVGDMDAKLDAAKANGLRLVAPAANRDSARPRAAILVDWAETIRQADRYARRVRPARTGAAVMTVLAVLVLIGGGLYAVQQRAANQNSQAVESSVALAQEADSLRTTDPGTAMWLSLTAYHSYPTPQARTALYNSYRTPYPLALPGRGRGTVASVAYSPDGRTAAAAWGDGSVRLWNLTDPRHPGLIATLDAGPGSELAYSPDGHVLAVRTARSLQLWKVESGLSLLSSTPVVSADAPGSAPGSAGQRWPVAFSPGGDTVATGDGALVRLWDVSEPRHPVPAAALSAPGGDVNAVAFSPGGDTLAVAGGSLIRLWNVADPSRAVPRASLAVRSAASVAFSSDGRLLAAGGSGEQVSVWNAARPGRAVAETAGYNPVDPGGDIDSVAFRPGDDVLVTTDTAGQTEIWTSDGSPQGTVMGQDGLPDRAGPDAAAFSPDGRRLLTGDQGGRAQIWTVPAPLIAGTEDGATAGTSNESPVSSGGTLLVTNGVDAVGSGGVKLWDIADPAHPSMTAALPPSWVNGGFLPDGRTLFTESAAEDSSQDTIRLWNVASPRHPRAEATMPGGDWTAGNGRMLVWDQADSSVRLWDITDPGRPFLDATFGPARQLPASISPEPLVLFAGDLAGVGDGGSLDLWNLSDSRHPVRAGTIPIGVNAVWAYQPSGPLLMLGGDFPAVTALWNLGSARTPARSGSIDMDAGTGAWLNARTLAGFTRQDSSLNLWDVGDPARPAAAAALPLDSTDTAQPGANIQVSPGTRLLAAGITSSQAKTTFLEMWRASADDRSLSEYARLTGDSGSYALAPNGNFLVTDLYSNQTDGAQDELNAFTSQPNTGISIIYPLDTDSVYRQLCSLASPVPISQYQPATYYRPACS